MLPKWVLPLAAGSFFTGLALLIAGPIVLASIVPLDLEAVAPEPPPKDPEAFKAYEAERMAELEERFGVLIWVFPIAGAMLFSGATGLLLVWVARPLGSDMDEPTEEDADAAVESAGDDAPPA